MFGQINYDFTMYLVMHEKLNNRGNSEKIGTISAKTAANSGKIAANSGKPGFQSASKP
jgi:hypothetical protein